MARPNLPSGRARQDDKTEAVTFKHEVPYLVMSPGGPRHQDGLAG